MTLLQKKISEIDREIIKLEQEIKQLRKRKEDLLESLSEFSMEDHLCDIPDFPKIGKKCWQLYGAGIKTVNDLVHSSYFELYKIPGIGKTYLKYVGDWMNKYELTLVE